jgi:dephospho-CoA kinase
VSSTHAIKPLIGLTGGIASGKSTVAKQLTELGVVVVDADRLAREVVTKGSDALAEIVSAFGSEVLAADGGLDRERLGKRVFADPHARQRLNAIVHPRIALLSAQRIQQAQLSATPYVVYEAPLLVETGAHLGMAALIVVAAPPNLQLDRIVTRDGLEPEAAGERLAAQAPLEAKLAVADYVIDNIADLSSLHEKTKQVHAEILQRFGLTSAKSGVDTTH